MGIILQLLPLTRSLLPLGKETESMFCSQAFDTEYHPLCVTMMMIITKKEYESVWVTECERVAMAEKELFSTNVLRRPSCPHLLPSTCHHQHLLPV